MPRFAFRRLVMVALASLFLVIACASQPDAPSASQSAQPLRSGVNPWPGYSGHYVALQKGLFSAAGLNVEETFFQSASDEITAFLADKLDVGWFTSGDAIQMVAKDPSIKMIYLVDYSNGSDGILGRDINNPQDLKGKTVARENILFENVLLRAYLEKGGLTEQDIVLKDMTAGDAAVAFAAKRVDAAVSYEPWLSKGAKEGGGEVIFSTKDTNLIADVITVRESTIQSRRTELQAYLRAVDQAVKLVNAGDQEAIQITASKLGVSPEEAQAQITGVKIFDVEGNKSIGFNLDNPSNVISNFELTAKAAYDFKLVSQPLDVKSLYDDSIVKSL